MNADSPILRTVYANIQERCEKAQKRLDLALDRRDRAYALPRNHDVEAVKAEAAQRGETLPDWELRLRVDIRIQTRQTAYHNAYRKAFAELESAKLRQTTVAQQIAQGLAAAAAKRGDLWKLPPTEEGSR